MKDFGRRRDDYLNRLPGAVFGRWRDDYHFDQSPFLLGVVTSDFRLKVVNAAWEKSLGYDRAELVNRPLSAFVGPEEHIIVRRLLNPRSTVGDNESLEFSLRRKDGTYRCFSWSRRSVPAEQVVLITGKDVTEQKKLETTSKLEMFRKKGRKE